MLMVSGKDGQVNLGRIERTFGCGPGGVGLNSEGDQAI
jgi:hypothetical protein